VQQSRTDASNGKKGTLACMTLRVINQAGNKTDYEADFVPRIGERIVLTYKSGSDPLAEHSFRVQDVMYRLDNRPDIQAAILVTEENNPQPWA
jgi:hypothetical protein